MSDTASPDRPLGGDPRMSIDRPEGGAVVDLGGGKPMVEGD
jgi:hypothetical protein